MKAAVTTMPPSDDTALANRGTELHAENSQRSLQAGSKTGDGATVVLCRIRTL